MTTSALASRALPRSWTFTVLGVIAIGAASLVVNLPRIHVYLKYWGAASPRIANPFAALSGDMDEKALRAALPELSLRCIAEAKAVNGLGDRVCYSSVDRIDGAPALTVAFFLDSGRLAHAVVQVPWWGHHAAARSLVTRFGMPEAIQDTPVRGSRLVQWRLASGLVEINRDPGWDPLGWSALYWKAERPARSAADGSRSR
jgi:hypothetical protein